MKILENKKDLEAAGASEDDLQDFDAAADCLAAIGREAKDAVPLLIELAKNDRNRKKDHYRKRYGIVAIIDDLKDHLDFSANEKIIESFEKHKSEIDENDRLRPGCDH
jgi:hypothetical protein